MRLMKSDAFELFSACVDGTLADCKVEWNSGYAVSIILASHGYPDEYKKGLPITGIEEAEKVEGVIVFHAGTKREGNSLVTDGGRALSVSAVGDTLKQTLDRAYDGISKIHFEGLLFRRDIGAKALDCQPEKTIRLPGRSLSG